MPYNPEWQKEFLKIKNMLLEHIGDLVITIKHVGSTSVEGLSAKPIIDLDVVIDSYEVLPLIIKRLRKVGYKHEGDLGIEGREAFKKVTKDNLMKHHLYVCPKNGKGYIDHITLRNYLRENEQARREYENLKKQLAEKYPNDIDSYCEGKSEFIQSILEKCD